MASKDRLGSKASQAAKAAQSNRYLQRLIEDQELRANLLSAYGTARSAYGRMTNGKPASKALFEDRKLQDELKTVVESLRDAGSTLREAPAAPARRRRRKGRSLLLIVAGGLIAVALNEGLRAKLLDLLFGAEETFDYSSTTAPATPEPAGMASA
jgi:hypothetical protein